MLIVDSPAAWSKNKDTAAADAKKGLADLGLSGDAARNAALYFPRVLQADPLRDGQIDTFVPCGIIAGIMARTDTSGAVSRRRWRDIRADTPVGVRKNKFGPVDSTDGESPPAAIFASLVRSLARMLPVCRLSPLGSGFQRSGRLPRTRPDVSEVRDRPGSPAQRYRRSRTYRRRARRGQCAERGERRCPSGAQPVLKVAADRFAFPDSCGRSSR